jgi:hypothetical protein
MPKTMRVTALIGTQIGLGFLLAAALSIATILLGRIAVTRFLSICTARGPGRIRRTDG